MASFFDPFPILFSVVKKGSAGCRKKSRKVKIAGIDMGLEFTSPSSNTCH
jgi:hypothetical protein